MGAEAVIQAISTLGFPIGVCVICFWFINKLTEQHKEEIDKLSVSVNNNTLVMQKLVDRLGVGNNENKS